MESLGESQPGVLRMTMDSIEDIWGERTPYKHEWLTRVDERVMEEPDK
jgi:ferredoxin-nitrate reductase